MAKKLTLKSPTVEIILMMDESNWCNVEMNIGERNYQLGGDTREIVKSRLITALGPKPIINDRVMNGLDVCWIITFFAHHYSIYAADVNGNRKIFFHDVHGKLMVSMIINLATRKSWVELLRRV